MTFVVTEQCIRCKFTDCVQVCPVDCFYAGETMVVISPDKCIDCGACAPECPVKAIVPDTDELAERWLPINAEYSTQWPVIRSRQAHGLDADAHRNEPGKFEKYFSPMPDSSVRD